MKTRKTKKTAETADVAAQGAHVAPEKAGPTKAATSAKNAAKGKTAAKAPKSATPAKVSARSGKKGTEPAKKTGTPRAESKGAMILALVRRPKGATQAELMTATGWQKHSVRGFLSNASKKLGVKVESAKNEAGERTYRIG